MSDVASQPSPADGEPNDRIVTRKGFAYVTHANRLLIFSHPHAPEAGLQVPAGSLLDGESPEDGALREAREETGLSGLRVVRFLGDVKFDRAAQWDGANEIHHRFFFHVACDEEPPERWQHHELDPSDGSEPPLFEFWWVSIPHDVPPLIAGHDAMLPALYEALALADSVNRLPSRPSDL
jgi:8-oxo-dGTP pyrophosphatase MutT (NUDIX family)